jgi:hypothetical protein
MASFGSWTPDLPDYGHDGLVIARNVYPGQLGYEPLRSLVPVTTALPLLWRGGGAFDDMTGGFALLAGTNEGLYAYGTGAWAEAYATTTTQKWFFVQFGDTVIGVNGGAPVKYTMSTGTGAALGGSPPDAAMAAIVKDFVFVAGDPSARSTVTWSAVNNSEGWTIGSDQCDDQLIPDGGDITGLAGGEYGVVFQRSAINVFEYVGVPTLFNRRKVSESIGCLTHGSIAQAGKMVFFLSNRGFYLFNDGELIPIGEGKVDRTFFGTYSVLEIEANMTAAIEPNLKLVMWAMQDRIWVYNWAADKWSEISQSGVKAITTGRTGYVTLDQLALLYPGGTDTVPYGTDDPLFSGGDPSLFVVTSDLMLNAFGGSSLLPANLRMAKFEPFTGLDAHVRNVRPLGDVGPGVTVHMDCAARLNDAMTRVSTNDLRPNGDMPVLARGRFLQPEIVTTAGMDWKYIVGLDIEGTAGGRL